MRKNLIILCLALLSTAARGQIANRSLGVSVGALHLDGLSASIPWAVPVALDGSLYLENGFEATAQLGVALVHDGTSGLNGWAVDGPWLGVRYLFREEAVRPSVRLEAGYLRAFGVRSLDPSSANTGLGFVGVSASGGVEVLVTESVSLGARGRLNVYFTLQQAWLAAGLELSAHAYF